MFCNGSTITLKVSLGIISFTKMLEINAELFFVSFHEIRKATDEKRIVKAEKAKKKTRNETSARFSPCVCQRPVEHFGRFQFPIWGKMGGTFLTKIWRSRKRQLEERNFRDFISKFLNKTANKFVNSFLRPNKFF
jgi:hypothetical protein